jgi:hypothetical protein
MIQFSSTPNRGDAQLTAREWKHLMKNAKTKGQIFQSEDESEHTYILLLSLQIVQHLFEVLQCYIPSNLKSKTRIGRL